MTTTDPRLARIGAGSLSIRQNQHATVSLQPIRVPNPRKWLGCGGVIEVVAGVLISSIGSGDKTRHMGFVWAKRKADYGYPSETDHGRTPEVEAMKPWDRPGVGCSMNTEVSGFRGTRRNRHVHSKKHRCSTPCHRISAVQARPWSGQWNKAIDQNGPLQHTNGHHILCRRSTR